MTFSKKLVQFFLGDNMKNILIAGVAKSGKSLFCKKLAKKTNYNHIPLDYFTASMKRNFPDLGIKSSVIINDTSKKLSILLNTVTNSIDDTDEKFIIDSAHIMPSDIIDNINRDNWNIYFFGYPNISVKDKLSEDLKQSKHIDIITNISFLNPSKIVTKGIFNVNLEISNIEKIGGPKNLGSNKLEITYNSTNTYFLIEDIYHVSEKTKITR